MQTTLNEGLTALKDEIGRLDDIRQRIDAATEASTVSPDVARAEERISCSLQVAVASLERDAALLDSRLSQQEAKAYRN